MIRRIVSLSVLFALVLSLLVFPQQSAQAAPGNPTLLAEVNGPGKGRVWVGAVPANSSTKPVLVFVHGLHGKATNWWGPTTYHGTNDMYVRAYNSGYRTAFVSLDDEVDGPASSMWNNGDTLKRQLDVITAHYGVSSVNIVAHSKGGVDTNSAVIHYGASAKVQKIVTLSSPHHGSQLADLAYSWWAGWLASLLGQRDDGTYTMQTSYMSYFRSVTDGSSAYNNVRFFTSGGTAHGPWFSAMWFGGAYLPGDNDGVVTVSSSHHPRQYSRLFTTGLDHDNIRKGSDVWWRIEPTVRTFFRSGLMAESGLIAEEATPVQASPASNLILRGGELSGAQASATLPVESGVKSVTFDVIGSNDGMSVTFVGPDGSRVAAAAPVADGEMFAGAWHYAATVAAPAAGTWTVEINGKAGQAYLLTASLDSALRVNVASPLQVKPGAALNPTISAKGAASLQVNALLSGTATGSQQFNTLRTQQTLSATGSNSATLSALAPASTGLYQLGLTVTGTTADGSAFERSFPLNFAVLTGSEGIDALPAGK